MQAITKYYKQLGIICSSQFNCYNTDEFEYLKLGRVNW